jgi:NAD-dependent dihydropyrimidine dehydrogenase PreA subunit
MSSQMAWVDEPRCVGCGTCMSACPVEAITVADGKARVDDGCTGCGACVDVCPEGAIQLVLRGELVTVAEPSVPAEYRPSSLAEGAGPVAVGAGLGLLAKAGAALARAVWGWLSSPGTDTGQAGAEDRSYAGLGDGGGSRRARRRRRGGRG